ncbi:MAG: MBL fold metallo-hydrolase [Planctomycetota bacterium]
MLDVSLHFLGTGTSAGVPMIGCDCVTCTSDDPRDKRMRCSVVISYGNTSVLVDTTPELRLQAIDNGVKRIDAVVYTHAHADHIMGLDELRRFNSIKGGPLDVHVDREHFEVINSCFAYAFREPDPNAGVYRPYLIPNFIDGDFDIDGVTWRPIPLLHGSMPILGFRVGNLAYCTDVSEIPPHSWAKLRGLDVLVLDALQWRKHPTHFNIEEALEVVQRLQPRRTLFTHLAHGVLYERDQPKLPPGVEFAVDGQRVVSRS